MRQYETLFIIKPDLSEEELKNVVEKYKNLLSNHGAEIVSVDEWGQRKLAYEIEKKYNEGYYVLINFDAESDALEELERVFRLDGNILRFIVVHRIEKAS